MLSRPAKHVIGRQHVYCTALEHMPPPAGGPLGVSRPQAPGLAGQGDGDHRAAPGDQRDPESDSDHRDRRRRADHWVPGNDAGRWDRLEGNRAAGTVASRTGELVRQCRTRASRR